MEHNMKVYVIKLAMRGVSPMIWRRLMISGDTSLAKLHYIIQTMFGWRDRHLHLFHIYGKDYGITHLGGLDFDDDPNQVFFDEFAFDIGDKFVYEYNFSKKNFVDIRIEKITDSTSLVVNSCLQGKGMPGIKEEDKTKLIIKFLDRTVYKKKMPSTKKIRTLVTTYDSMVFNKIKINQTIQTENF